ncbi:MAG TPA: hypothetical protein VFR04_07815 [Solirubrobacterales bacterium]|nr:hypothetical protein [Solirubrobacterales bacterium]
MTRHLDSDRSRCGRAAATAALVLAALLLSLLAAPLAVALPAGRAYEQVTPADKNGGDVGGPAVEGQLANALGQSAPDGDSIGYLSFSSFADALSSEALTNYVSSRGGEGWSTHAVAPPPAAPVRLFQSSPFRFFASDLSSGLLEWREPALAVGAPQDFENLYVRDSDGRYRVVTGIAPATLSPSSYDVTFAGATPDLGRVVFEANDALTAAAPAGMRSVYEWDGASLRLVSVLPGGEAAPGASAGAGGSENFTVVISDDGSRIFWTAGEQLYVRENGTRTVKLNASQRAISLGDGSAKLLATTPDGGKAFFTDPTALTDAPDDNGGLYEYDLDSEGLRNLTPAAGGGPEVRGVLGIGDDGAAVYFAAGAALAPGAQAGAANLYLAHGGAIELIAILADGDASNWASNPEAGTARVTPDGTHLAFLSVASLTGYDNTDAVSGNPYRELFVYDQVEGRLTCVSCNPTGARPLGGASIPGRPAGTYPGYVPRVLSDDGRRAFFNSNDALVALDGNRRQDVYEFEGGRAQLISGGTSNDMSALVDVSADGRDVFFTTRDRLTATDRDNNTDIYDARVGGGFPAATELLPCAGEACRGSLAALPAAGPLPATLWPRRGRAGPAAVHGRGGCRRSNRATRGRARSGPSPRRCQRRVTERGHVDRARGDSRRGAQER